MAMVMANPITNWYIVSPMTSQKVMVPMFWNIV